MEYAEHQSAIMEAMIVAERWCRSQGCTWESVCRAAAGFASERYGMHGQTVFEAVADEYRQREITENDPLILGDEDIAAIRENAAITLGIVNDRSPADGSKLSPLDLQEMYEAAISRLWAWQEISGEPPAYFLRNEGDD